MAGNSSDERPRAILLTGASGFIGKALASHLLEHGYKLRILTRDSSSIENIPWSGKVEIRMGDIRYPRMLAGICEGIDAAIHCAGFAHSHAGDDETHQAINFQGTVNLLDAAIEGKAEKFIYLSSSKAGASRPNAYARAKRMAEEKLLEAHRRALIDVCCLRPTAVYGPGMKGSLAGWIRLVKKGLAPPLPPVRTRIAMIGLDDLCEAVRRALQSTEVWGKVYQLSDGQAYEIKEIETRIRQALGAKPARVHLPRSFFAVAAALGEAARYFPGINIPFGRAGYNTLFLDEYAVDDTFQRDTGFSPRQNFYQELPSLLQEQQGS